MMNFESAEYNIHNNLSLQRFLSFNHAVNFVHSLKVFRFIFKLIKLIYIINIFVYFTCAQCIKCRSFYQQQNKSKKLFKIME